MPRITPQSISIRHGVPVLLGKVIEEAIAEALAVHPDRRSAQCCGTAEPLSRTWSGVALLVRAIVSPSRQHRCSMANGSLSPWLPYGLRAAAIAAMPLFNALSARLLAEYRHA